MGNCLFGGIGDGNEDMVKVVTSTGGIMEFVAPVTVEFITEEFPGHGIFRSHDLFWKPLLAQEVLLAGQSYYLLPLNKEQSNNIISTDHEDIDYNVMANIEIGHVRSNSVPLPPQIQNLVVAPYRLSVDSQGLLKRSYTEALYRYSNSNNNSNSRGQKQSKKKNSGGFWKVKLVISPKQLVEILSQENATQELIESVRTVAKCGKTTGGGVSSSANSVGFSDSWSLSSSRNTSSYKDALFSLDN